MNKFKGLLGAILASELAVFAYIAVLLVTTNKVSQVHWLQCAVLGLVNGLFIGGLLYAGAGARHTFRYGTLFGVALGLLGVGGGLYAGYEYTTPHIIATVVHMALLGFVTTLGYRVGSSLQVFVKVERDTVGIVEERSKVTIKLGASVGDVVVDGSAAKPVTAAPVVDAVAEKPVTAAGDAVAVAAPVVAPKGTTETVGGGAGATLVPGATGAHTVE